MKLRVLICLFLTLIILSDVTIVAATSHQHPTEIMVRVEAMRGCPTWSWGDEIVQTFVYIDNQQIINRNSNSTGHEFGFFYNYSIDVMEFVQIWHGVNYPDIELHVEFEISYHCGIQWRHRMGWGLGPHTLNIPGPAPPTPPVPINLSHALNFTLAGAMTLPTMSIGVVDDIMLIVGKYINCGLAKFAIRAALLKLAAKGVAITVAITAISYLLAEFADEIYYAIFTTVPEVHPGDTHFHKNDLPQVMGIIHSYFPTEPL